LAADPEICGLSADSRTVRPGFLFAALPGSKTDGRAYLTEAIANGAAAVLAPTGTTIGDSRVALVTDDNPRRRFSLMASRFFARQPAVIAAVTGTNGKTSVVTFARQIWTQCGFPAASLGTLGLVTHDRREPGSLTTPDPVALHRTLATLAAHGVSHAALEASSHGLDQYRLDGVDMAAAAFTNLTRDHLDYHDTPEAYWKAKQRLFAEVMPPGRTAVLNADAPECDRLAELCRRLGHTVITYGFAGRDVRIEQAVPVAQGQALALAVADRTYRVTLPLAGAFQASNAVCALALAIATGSDSEAAITSLEHLDGVPGRLQKVATRANGAAVYVDYAHTPNALETILAALRPHAKGRLVVVFGCGGDRDAGKRPEMGKIAARMADVVFVTDDNPRNENAAAIRRQILAACPGAAEIGDRREAVRSAVGLLESGDLLVIAGKGHETGQILKDRILPFDDALEAHRAVGEMP
jgi:UDP-N-acetylmuramoyl-L-alanyl-D-glutamate--2,6-diaminopimelate ligase